MNAPVYDVDGEQADTIELPTPFDTAVRTDLIERAVIAAQANRKQADGADPYAGMRTPAESPGSGRGMAHVPRENNMARRVPQAVKGRTAHPPKAEADQSVDINDKERQQAVRSAIAATTDTDRCRSRGHEFAEGLSLPLVVIDEFETLVKTQEVVGFLETVGAYDDVMRADNGRTIRSGRGTTRGRKYREPAALLVVTSSDAGPSKAARNLPGVDVGTATTVSAEDLAPGGQPGRLTLWTESAIAEVANR